MKPSTADILIGIADAVTFFRDADGDTAYASFDVRGHRETWPVRARGFKRYLIGQFYTAVQKAPGSQAVADALAVLEARAQYDSPVHRVHVRVAGDDDGIYLDLANARWEVVKVTADGWSVVTDPPVRFRRARGMLPLPVPTLGGCLKALQDFVNVENDEQWSLLTAWLVAALRPTGPYPVLTLLGEQGTAKSTTQEIFRSLIDPNVALLRAAPMDVRDVMVAANNGWCLAFDNLSTIDPWLSDCFCRLATGGGFSTRELYSDADETIFVAQRPVMVNGIDAIIERADLLDRALIIDLPRISDTQRRQRTSLWAAFEEQRPAILGALLDAVVIALKRHADVRLSTLPRLADFAAWAVASEPGLGLEEGAFVAAYSANRATAHDLALEASAIAGAVRALAEIGPWTGTAVDLLARLSGLADDITKKVKGWPSNPRALSSAVRRAAPNLRAVGVEVDFDREAGGHRRRVIRIKNVEASTVPIVPDVQDVAANSASNKRLDGRGDGRDDRDGTNPTQSNRLDTVPTVPDDQSFDCFDPPEDDDEVDLELTPRPAAREIRL
jgi:hypothetical protein